MEEDVQCDWKVRSCSSEADVHTASNVLKSELYRVWQTEHFADEAWLVLEAHPPSALSGLEIVNAGSALVEVFGLPEGCPQEDDDDFLMLLSAQQMMSSKDIIHKANRNRSFTYTCSDKLSQLAMQHRWKQIKVLCRQPFGLEEQRTCIGLSRITFKPCKTLEEVAADAAEARLQQNLKAGLAKMFPKGSSDEWEVVSEVTEPSRPLQTGKVDKDLGANLAGCGPESPSPLLRGKRKLPSWQSPSKDIKHGAKGGTNHNPVSSVEDEEIAKASQIKRATPKVEMSERKGPGTPSEERSNKKEQEQDVATSSKKRTISNEQEKEITKGPETSRPGSNKHAKRSALTSRKSSEPSGIESSSMPGAHQASQFKQTSASLQVLDEPESSSKRKEPPSSRTIGKQEETKSRSPANGGNKRPVQSSMGVLEPKQANATTVSFSKFLDGVIFAISGLVNPERAEIRDKALQMGGQYCPDWTANCTLLICAFANTPKFNQVKKDNGTIVSKDWILECSERKKLVGIEKYLMHAGKPWRQINASTMDKPDEECLLPSRLDCDEPMTTLASLQEVENWVLEDVTSSITWLKQQEVQPEANELQSVAIQGIQLCLDDTIECLKKKQSIKKIMESWDYVPRAVQELAAREDKAGKVRKKNFWSDMLSEAERLKWIYSKELENMTLTENQHVKQASLDGDDDTEDAATDGMPDDDASSEDTQILDEDDIREAKETISKMILSFI